MRWKTLFAILGLLLIGFIGGFFAHRMLMEQQIRKLSGKRTARGVEHIFLKTLQPEEEQKATLEPLLEKYAFRLSEISQIYHQQRQEVYDSLKMEVRPLLTSDQQERFDEMIDRLKYRRFKKRKGENKNHREKGKEDR
jgi:hypothetical protein